MDGRTLPMSVLTPSKDSTFKVPFWLITSQAVLSFRITLISSNPFHLLHVTSLANRSTRLSSGWCCMSHCECTMWYALSVQVFYCGVRFPPLQYQSSPCKVDCLSLYSTSPISKNRYGLFYSISASILPLISNKLLLS